MNHNPDAPQIHAQFFAVIDALTQKRVWRGRGGFTREYGLSQGSFHKLAQHPEWDIPAQYLYWLVRDHSASAEYLLMGKGDMFVKSRASNPRPTPPDPSQQGVTPQGH